MAKSSLPHWRKEVSRRLRAIEKRLTDLEEFNDGLVQGIQERIKGDKT